jgi:hypothetical protein
MILTNDFVFIHLPKTGGTFVRRTLERFAPSSWETQYFEGHPTVEDIPASHRGLPVIGMIRNPWSFYVSWYSFLCAKVKDYEYFNTVSGGGKLSFQETIRNVMNSEPVKSSGWGGYTYLVDFTYREKLRSVHYVRFESLREEFVKALDDVTVLPDDLRKALLESPAINASSHNSPATYYDDELVALIRDRDRPAFEMFGYLDMP